MTEPTTPTGKRLVSLNTPSETEYWTDIVTAIEREAREQAWDVDTLAAALLTLDDKADTDRIWRAMDYQTLAAAIIAALKEVRRG